MPARVAGLLLSLAALGAACDGVPATTGMIADAGAGTDLASEQPADAGAGTDLAGEMRADAGAGTDLASEMRADASSGADPGVAGCQDVCATQAMVDCPVKRDCLPSCLREIESDRCKNTTRAYVACARVLTTASYFCTPAGYAQLRPDVCQTEAAAVAHCAATDIDSP
jgi:hypothetical protein